MNYERNKKGARFLETQCRYIKINASQQVVGAIKLTFCELLVLTSSFTHDMQTIFICLLLLLKLKLHITHTSVLT